MRQSQSPAPSCLRMCVVAVAVSLFFAMFVRASPTPHHIVGSVPRPHLTSVTSPAHRFSTMSSLGAVAVDMSGCGWTGFTVPVYIGGQGPFNLQVDTGSSSLAVAGVDCGACAAYVQPRFNNSGYVNRALSPFFYTQQYADGGYVNAHVYDAAIAIGNTPGARGGSGPVDMTFGSIFYELYFFQPETCADNSVGVQGIIGFLRQYADNSGQSPRQQWLYQYTAAAGLPLEFTVQACEEKGHLWIGGYDSEFIAAPFQYVPLAPYDNANYYNVFLHAVTVGGESSGMTVADFGMCTTRSDNTTGSGPSVNCVHVDTGSSSSFFPPDVFASITDIIQADSNFQLYIGNQQNGSDFFSHSSCLPILNDSVTAAVLNSALPPLTFTFAASADPNDAAITVTVPASPGYVTLFHSTNGYAYWCSGIQSRSGNGSVLGAAFMSALTIRFDLVNNVIGFATSANCGAEAPPLNDWTVGEWSGCSAVCGGGSQWRRVVCADIDSGAVLNDAECVTAGPLPSRSQSCALTSCGSTTVNSPTAPTANTMIWPHDSVVAIHYTSNDAEFPTAIVLQSITTAALYYVTRNASISPYAYTVTTSLPLDSYRLGSYVTDPTAAAFGATVSVTECNTGQCNDTTCDCSEFGVCDESALTCACFGGYSGADCDTPPPADDCTILCFNSGKRNSSLCTCQCPPNFSGGMCERRFATAVLVVGTDYDVLNTEMSAFTSAFSVDVAYAAGLAASAITVSTVETVSAGVSSVLLTMTTGANTTALVTSLNALAYQIANRAYTTALTAGIATCNVSVLTVVTLPPADVGSQVGLMTYTPDSGGGGGGTGGLDPRIVAIVAPFIGLCLLIVIGVVIVAVYMRRKRSATVPEHGEPPTWADAAPVVVHAAPPPRPKRT